MVELPFGRPSLPSLPLSFARGAFLYAGLLFLSGIPAAFVSPFVGGPLMLGSLGVLYFYRDPSRATPASGIVAPSDGTVASVGWEDDRIRLGIYLGVRDVHVIRAPFGGRIRAVDRESGGHWPAPLARSEHNEAVHVRFDGAEVTMRVGWFARRITPYVAGGQRVRRGARLGHIAFGSRTEVLLPAGIEPVDLNVEPGERLRAGETVIVEADAYDREVRERSSLSMARDPDGESGDPPSR
ncbi:phosphatidylserine decarboxylase family protein [Halobacteriales archaeon QS_8_69_26]|nr:MAG: phosphatidylserine decarboxylase family protein [Halobacteriales archaeon QS_8_69_26]